MYRLQRKSIALYIILSIVTCGIFSIYWQYKLAEDVNYVKNDPNATSPALVVLFSIITCGIYYMYWMYKAGETVDAVRVQQGMMPGSKAVLYLVLSIFGLSIIAMALLQNDMNEMADGMNGMGGQGYGGGYNQPQYGQGVPQQPVQDRGTYGYGAPQQPAQPYTPYEAPQPSQSFVPYETPQQPAQNVPYEAPQQPFQDVQRGSVGVSGQDLGANPFEAGSGNAGAGSMMDDLNNQG